MFGRLKQMLIKELIQVVRDKRTRFILIGPPIIQMLVFGYAATFEIHNVSTVVRRPRQQPGEPRTGLPLHIEPLLQCVSNRSPMRIWRTNLSTRAKRRLRSKSTLDLRKSCERRDGPAAGDRRRHQLQHRTYRIGLHFANRAWLCATGTAESHRPHRAAVDRPDAVSLSRAAPMVQPRP